MEFTIVVLMIIGILGFLFKFLKFINSFLEKPNVKNLDNPNYYLPYKLRRSMMSDHERLLFENLRIVLDFNYDVYPQVNLDKIFCIERQRAYKFYLGCLRKINQKSVDFLIVEKNTQAPIFAIELDD